MSLWSTLTSWFPFPSRRRTTESVSTDIYGNLGWLDPRELYFTPVDGQAPFSPGWIPPYYHTSQKRGEALPIYLNEQQLRMLRDRSRILCASNEFAICGIENRINYVIGTGFTYRAVSDDPGVSRACQKILDAWSEVNGLSEIEAETLRRMDEDGEAFIRLFPINGLCELRFVEPEHVRAPFGDPYDERHTFGVESLHGDVESVVGYWVVNDPIRNPEPVFVPASDMVHFKLNTKRGSKRGLPTFYPVEQNLRRAEDLLASMSAMAKARAKIALIRRLSGVTSNAADALRSRLTDASVTDPTTGQQLNIERMRYGTIINASSNVDYEFPNHGVGSHDFVGVLQAELRAVAARLQMPEWMFTIDASNANYASSLVAEAPAVKSFGRLQSYLTKRFGEGRYRGRQSLAWRQLKCAVEAGLLPSRVLGSVEIQVEAPTLESRDKAAEANANKTYFEMGVKSKPTIQQELGLDSEQEEANFAKDAQAQQAQQQQQMGAPGEGQPQPQPAQEPIPASPEDVANMTPPSPFQDVNRVIPVPEEVAWDENKHPRGQPDNAGQFGPGGGHTSSDSASGGSGGGTQAGSIQPNSIQPGGAGAGTQPQQANTATPASAPAAPAIRISDAAKASLGRINKIAEQNGQKMLETLVNAKGWTGPKDVEAVKAALEQAYEKAEVTVNIQPDHIKHFMKDPRIKNAYETGLRGDAGYMKKRKEVEKAVFEMGDDVEDRDKPKYGAVSWDRNVYGAAPQYGSVVFVLNKDALKGRSSLTAGDSFGLRDNTKTATMESPHAAFGRCTKALMAAGYQPNDDWETAADATRGYTEVQMWGDVPLDSSHIKKIRMPSLEAAHGDVDSLVEFGKKSGIPVEFFHEETGKPVPYETAKEWSANAMKEAQKSSGVVGRLKSLFGF